VTNKEIIGKKKFTGLKFIISKIRYLEREILKEEKILLEKELSLNFKRIEQDIGQKLFDQEGDLSIKIEVKDYSAIDPLFYHLDSLIMELRRFIEYSLRFISVLSDFPDELKVQAICNQIRPDSKDTKSVFVQHLEKEQKLFYEYLQSKLDWFDELNKLRTKLTHYGIVNEISDFEINLFWDKGNTHLQKPSKIEIPRLEFLNENIGSFIKRHGSNTDDLFRTTVDLASKILKIELK